jgi:FKBP-type peptidyl-prolyl cis-trans isomerase
MKHKSFKILGTAIALTMAISSGTTLAASPTTTNATQASTPAPVDMGKVSYIMGYGMGKMFSTEKVKINNDQLQAGFNDAQKNQAEDPAKKDMKDYRIGYNIGTKFKMDKINIQFDQFQKGLSDGGQGKTSQIDKKDSQQAMMAFIQNKMQQYKAQSVLNKKSSAKYMSNIQSQSGIQTIQKGLYYRVITPGNGPVPQATDTVSVNYEGTLPNGTVFDSSFKRGQPVSFPVNGVIKGWTKTLEKMPVGSTWMVYISPELAYGENAPQIIGPDQALTFKIDLLKIEKSSTSATPKADTKKSS